MTEIHDKVFFRMSIIVFLVLPQDQSRLPAPNLFDIV